MAASKKYRLKLMRAKCTQRRQGCTKCGKYSENYLFKYNCKDSQRNSVANETPHAFCTQPSLLLYTCIESNTKSNEMCEAVKKPPFLPLLVSNCSGMQFENFFANTLKLVTLKRLSLLLFAYIALANVIVVSTLARSVVNIIRLSESNLCRNLRELQFRCVTFLRSSLVNVAITQAQTKHAIATFIHIQGAYCNRYLYMQ